MKRRRKAEEVSTLRRIDLQRGNDVGPSLVSTSLLNPLKIIPEITHMQGKRRLRRFFFAEPLPPKGERLILSLSESRHLRQILRLKPGDACLVTDGSGQEAEAEVCDFSLKGEATLKIRTSRQPLSDTACFIRALPALTKGKMDFLVEKAQELGVNAFRPVMTARSEMKFNRETQERVVTRWQKKAREAAKQSGSLRLMEIGSVLSLRDVLGEIPAEESAVIFHPSNESIPFSVWVQELAAKQDSKLRLNLFFGPEGGFDEKELEAAKKQSPSLILVNLGPSILRVETAYVGVLAAVRFLLP